MARNVDVMTSQCPQKIRKGIYEIPCEFYSILANQIACMCNKQSALEYTFFYITKRQLVPLPRFSKGCYLTPCCQTEFIILFANTFKRNYCNKFLVGGCIPKNGCTLCEVHCPFLLGIPLSNDKLLQPLLII